MKGYKAWVLNENYCSQQEEVITIIPEYLFDEFNRWRQFRPDQTEACGIIYGERRGKHFLVTGITTPKLTDIRTRYSCMRNTYGHQQTLDFLHKKSNGITQYLGEWHSHPQKIASPSYTDLKEWQLTYNYLFKEQSIDKMLCLILGIEKDWLGIYEKGKLFTIYSK
ncbi:Mov34/MPN/PAD-1 family protein [Acinetobacter baumannii]|uniref:Mov34/MPN/PAD-1 family protein n=1 Tax=Acinetobacter baumannii TaxID=470 RepID=UPI0029D5ACF8|nr:Mov34/MPN/PAD-1 family protein [Acinetobacter baumannii]